jgi:hypothetical protein
MQMHDFNDLCFTRKIRVVEKGPAPVRTFKLAGKQGVIKAGEKFLRPEPLPKQVLAAVAEKILAGKPVRILRAKLNFSLT